MSEPVDVVAQMRLLVDPFDDGNESVLSLRARGWIAELERLQAREVEATMFLRLMLTRLTEFIGVSEWKGMLNRVEQFNIPDRRKQMKQTINDVEYDIGPFADLRNANLSRANLTGANLTGANFTGADLSGADLSRANLSGAYLSGVNFTGAHLRGAYLWHADFTGVNLWRADLTGADFTDANLTDANLRGADLHGATLPDGTKFIDQLAKFTNPTGDSK